MSIPRLLVVASCLIVAFATGINPSSAQNDGGKSALPTDDKRAVAAARFAVDAKSKTEQVTLVKILKAEVQVVAGRNYYLTLDIGVKVGVRTAQVKVFASLDGKYELSQWDWSGEVRSEKKAPQPKSDKTDPSSQLWLKDAAKKSQALAATLQQIPPAQMPQSEIDGNTGWSNDKQFRPPFEEMIELPELGKSQAILKIDAHGAGGTDSYGAFTFEPFYLRPAAK